MSIKPKYTNYESAPMVFFHILKYGLWLIIALTIYTIILVARVIPPSDYFTSEYIAFDIALVMEIIIVLFSIKAALGLRKREWSGVKALFCAALLTIVAYFIIIIFAVVKSRFVYGDFNIIRPIVIELVLIGIFVLLWIYFGKRRLLFYPFANEYEGPAINVEGAIRQNNINSKVPDYIAVNKVNSSTESVLEETTEKPKGKYDNVVAETEHAEHLEEDGIKFCFKCGHEIGPNALFCEKCGTKVRRNK